jgi:hypothetical protein
MFGLSKKITHSLFLAVLFFVVSSPMTYQLVDNVVGGIVASLIPQFSSFFKVAMAGCPTTYGLALHAVIFGLISYFFLHHSA